ncbi:MAG TPA: tetratricopeptide repeat protein [Lysobacter sp.]
MTAFVIAAAVLALLALGFVLRPLWRDKRLAGIGMIAGLALTTALLYTQIGTPKALDSSQLRAPETLADAVAQLEAELKRDPAQVEGWVLLGRAYAAEDRPADARDAFEKAAKLAPDNPDLLVEAAQARAIAAGNQFDAQGIAMLQQALAKQPMHQRARWFLGIAQRQSKQSAEAAKTWEPLLAVVDPRTAASLREQIDAARRDAGLEPLPVPAVAPATDTGITVKVALAPALAAKLPANATLFVIARQPKGPPMPVAVEKLAATGFPRTVTLDDGDSPMPTMKLSQLAQVEVTARVSASGDAIPHAGDFEATAKASGNTGTIELVIDRVRQ